MTSEEKFTHKIKGLNDRMAIAEKRIETEQQKIATLRTKIETTEEELEAYKNSPHKISKINFCAPGSEGEKILKLINETGVIDYKFIATDILEENNDKNRGKLYSRIGNWKRYGWLTKVDGMWKLSDEIKEKMGQAKG